MAILQTASAYTAGSYSKLPQADTKQAQKREVTTLPFLLFRLLDTQSYRNCEWSRFG
jgi:hypothetical protein